MLNIYIGELFKFFKRSFFWFFGAFVAVVFFIFFAVMLKAQQTENGISTYGLIKNLTFPLVYFSGIKFASSLFSFCSLIMISSIAGNEYGWNTYKTIATRGTGKLDFINTKFLAVLSYTILFTICGVLILTGMASINQSEILTHVQPTENLNGWFAFMMFGIMLLGLLPYISFGLMLTTLTKSSGVGIAIGLVYFIIGENIIQAFCFLLAGNVGEWLKDVPKYLPGNQLDLLMNIDNLTLKGGWEFLVDIWKPMLISLGYAVGFYAISVAVMKKRDILG